MKSQATLTHAGRRSARPYIPLLLPLLAALLVRLLAWRILPYHGPIADEAEYLVAATRLARGRGFSFYQEWLWTRPPLYLIFLAAHIRFFGPDNLLPIRLSQSLISVVTVGLAALARHDLMTTQRYVDRGSSYHIAGSNALDAVDPHLPHSRGTAGATISWTTP
jgi:hypothetical protein